MVRNAATNLIRDRRRNSTFEAPLRENISFALDDSEADDQKRSIRLREALTHLSTEERDLLRMRFWKGISVRQISEKKGLSYSATAVRFFRILQRLRTWLGPNV
jgi:RNA polymerase sigma factor (sigma-70 family)